jgi:hypothetical protein
MSPKTAQKSKLAKVKKAAEKAAKAKTVAPVNVSKAVY